MHCLPTKGRTTTAEQIMVRTVSSRSCTKRQFSESTESYRCCKPRPSRPLRGSPKVKTWICQNADIDSLYSWLNTTRDTIDAPVLRNHDITRLSYNESHGPSRLMLVLVAAQRKGWFKRISPLSEGWDWQPGDSAQLDATLWDTCVDARIVGHGRIAKQSSSSVPALQAQLQALQRENRALRAHNEELSAENCLLRPWYITGLGELLDLRT